VDPVVRAGGVAALVVRKRCATSFIKVHLSTTSAVVASAIDCMELAGADTGLALKHFHRRARKVVAHANVYLPGFFALLQRVSRTDLKGRVGPAFITIGVLNDPTRGIKSATDHIEVAAT